MSEHGDVDAIGILRIDQNRSDLLAIAQSKMGPGLAAIARLVHPIASREVGTTHSSPAAHKNDFWIRGCKSQSSNGAGGLPIKNRFPGAPKVVLFPTPAIIRRHKENV